MAIIYFSTFSNNLVLKCCVLLIIVNKEAEMKQTIGHYTLEVIGACAFGIKCDALSNENAYFYKVCTQISFE